MIDNIEYIKPLLKFESKDDFYYLQLLQRKKDNPEIGANSRVIKNYYITSLDYLEEKYEEIKNLCKVFNARASIRLNKRSFEKVAYKTLETIANTMGNKDFFHIKNQYDRACGLIQNEIKKKWIIDVDKADIDANINTSTIKRALVNCQPFDENKFITVIPSKTGYHVITYPFNVSQFRLFFPSVEIHKDNPVNLFIV